MKETSWRIFRPGPASIICAARPGTCCAPRGRATPPPPAASGRPRRLLHAHRRAAARQPAGQILRPGRPGTHRPASLQRRCLIHPDVRNLRRPSMATRYRRRHHQRRPAQLRAVRCPRAAARHAGQRRQPQPWPATQPTPSPTTFPACDQCRWTSSSGTTGNAQNGRAPARSSAPTADWARRSKSGYPESEFRPAGRRTRHAPQSQRKTARYPRINRSACVAAKIRVRHGGTDRRVRPGRALGPRQTRRVHL